jgi:predicted GIY-YIG superfamily endonuclease
MQTWHVYQLRSDTELLYVGYTRQLKKRLNQHKNQKPWWPEVTDIRPEEFSSEDEARQREKELWAAERPKYNKLSPFLTEEEAQQSNRERTRRSHRSARGRARQREYNRTPLRRQSKREDAARRRASGLGRRWKQTGPGLF